MQRSVRINGVEFQVVINHEKVCGATLATYAARTDNQVQVGDVTIFKSYANGSTQEEAFNSLEHAIRQAVDSGKSYEEGQYCYALILEKT